jgi:site-specific DNA-methyltransferase (adenine-specific)
MEILPTLETVGAVVTDPPYAIPATHYVAKRGEKQVRRSLGELSIVEGWFRAVSDMFPETAALYIFCDGQSYPMFYRACYSRWKRVRPVIWDKMTSFNGYTWRHQHELIAWCESDTCDRIPTGDGDIIKCRAVPVNDRTHPAEKPVDLLVHLLKKTKGIVLDPFMGSGTTGVACSILGRKFIGIEVEPKYFDLACQRIDAAHKQQPLIA